MAVFDHNLFQHVLDSKKKETGKESGLLKLLVRIYKNKAFYILLTFFEKILTFILNLPIPFYSGLIKILITNLSGLPGMSGCYIRALYYKGKFKYMGKNVIIVQGAIFHYPEKVELADFSFIDKD